MPPLSSLEAEQSKATFKDVSLATRQDGTGVRFTCTCTPGPVLWSAKRARRNREPIGKAVVSREVVNEPRPKSGASREGRGKKFWPSVEASNTICRVSMVTGSVRAAQRRTLLLPTIRPSFGKIKVTPADVT